ncbi:MAG: hypothetical protein ABIL09_01060 [Gemmatimonadota bacterium]
MSPGALDGTDIPGHLLAVERHTGDWRVTIGIRQDLAASHQKEPRLARSTA